MDTFLTVNDLKGKDTRRNKKIMGISVVADMAEVLNDQPDFLLRYESVVREHQSLVESLHHVIIWIEYRIPYVGRIGNDLPGFPSGLDLDSMSEDILVSRPDQFGTIDGVAGHATFLFHYFISCLPSGDILGDLDLCGINIPCIESRIR